MKLSMSLPEDDVSFVDAYAARTGGATRPAVPHQAIALLRAADLETEYARRIDDALRTHLSLT
ncbi:hypothetical protein [Rhizomonospora bruguierae]|uniref:hypothetical protein n=1 Tax=Rhizomonospora bruguierae TaxID=1581705 RepID=UPI001BD014B0|nr:hypothetical protein [Micromonospora sp. NBRC 107566]